MVLSRLNQTELLQLFAEYTNVVFWVRTAEKMLYINPTYEKVWGRSCQSLLQNPNSFVEAIHPEDREATLQCIAQETYDKGPLTLEYRMIRADGEIRWIAVKQSRLDRQPEFAHLGQEAIYVGSAVDVTEQKQLALNLVQSEEKFRLIAENTSDGILVLENGVVTYASPAYFQQLGYDEQEDIGRNADEIALLLHPDDRDKTFTAIYQAIENHQPELTYRYRAKTKRGHYIWREDHARFVYDEQGTYLRSYVVCRDITENLRKDELIEELNSMDPLTLMANWRKFSSDYELAASALKPNFHHGLLLIDLDDFRNVNDIYGHHTGDLILKFMASRLRNQLTESVDIARLGGDEFVVLFKNIAAEFLPSKHELEKTIKQLSDELSRTFTLFPKPTQRQKFNLTASFGVTLFQGVVDLKKLFVEAELALYRAKADGKNQIAFYDIGLQTQLNHRLQLEQDLRVALQNNEFELYYQPQLGLHQCVVGAECLLRWKHPVRGFVAPDEFISVAEEKGLISSIGFWVLKQACVQLANWEKQPALAPLTLAVNVSVSHFLTDYFVENLVELLNETSAPPHKLKIELTESLLIHQKDKAVNHMQRLKALGITFSMDDFGTGYSSLSYLKTLPFDQVKIDRSFIMRLPEMAADGEIVKAIIVLSQILCLEVIAEGVETAEQVDYLKAQECYHFQGYFFAKPMSLGEFLDWLNAWPKRCLA